MLTFAISTLQAQGTTYEVNYASITFVNVELGDDCSRLILPSNILSGDGDIDGDGLVPPAGAFIISIDDADPTNGPILDGCGEFNYEIIPNPDSTVIGFTFGSGTITSRDVTPPVQFFNCRILRTILLHPTSGPNH